MLSFCVLNRTAELDLELELDPASKGVSSEVKGVSSRGLEDGPGAALPEPEVCAGECMTIGLNECDRIARKSILLHDLRITRSALLSEWFGGMTCVTPLLSP